MVDGRAVEYLFPVSNGAIERNECLGLGLVIAAGHIGHSGFKDVVEFLRFDRR